MPSATSFTYENFLAALPAERRQAVEQVWAAVRAALPAGYQEEVSPTMLQFVAGKEMAVALANKKNYVSLYLMTLYHFPEQGEQLKAAAPKLKMGKSCLNFIRAEDLPLAALGEMLRAVSPAEFLQRAEANRLNPHQK